MSRSSNEAPQRPEGASSSPLSRLDAGPKGVVTVPKQAAAAPAQQENERKLHCKRGDKVEFPVPAEHPHSIHQTLTPVRSAEDIGDFLGLWATVAEARDQPPPAPADLVAQLKRDEISVLRVAATSLRIPKGAVLTLNNPLNHIECDEVTIAGDLVAHGELVVRCNTLTLE